MTTIPKQDLTEIVVTLKSLKPPVVFEDLTEAMLYVWEVGTYNVKHITIDGKPIIVGNVWNH